MLDRKHWPKNLTDARIYAAVGRRMFDLDNVGYCLSCGNEQGGCEPDARRYRCESCGDKNVYGADELMLVLL